MSKITRISQSIFFLISFLLFINLTKNELLEEYNLEKFFIKSYSLFSPILYNGYKNSIFLQNNINYYSHLQKDEYDSFKIHILKDNYDNIYERFHITLNITNNDALISFNNITNYFNIINKSNDQNICYEFIPSKDYPNLSDDIDILINIKATKDIYYFINYNIIPFIYEFEFDKVEKINKINDFPLNISIKLPFKDAKNSNDLLFNLYFYSKYVNFENTKNFYDFDIIVTVINENLKEQIIKNKKTDFKSILYSSIDISTKTDAFKISKDFIKNALNSLGEENNSDDIYLYIRIINKNPNENIDINNYLNCTLFLIYDDYKNYIINQTNYISSKIYYDEDHEEKNYDLYHLQLDNPKDNIFAVDFSSNFALSRGIYVSFLDYDIQKKIKDKDGKIYDNSSKIEFIKSDTKKGKNFHFEFKLKDPNKKDIILCIFVKSDELDIYNYIFKYKTFNSDDNNNKIIYKLNDEVTHLNKDNKTILEIENVQIINNNSKINYYKGEIYIRKIINKNKIDREDLDTIAIFKSKYELVQGNIEYEKDNQKIKITIPKIYKRDHYSILIDIPEINEKFVYNTVNKKKITKPYWAIITIFIFIPLYLIVVVFAIIYLANKHFDLKEELLNTSFKISSSDEDLKQDKDEGNNALE